MHDIKFIRENPAAFDAGLKKRGLEPLSDGLLKVDHDARALQTAMQELQAKGNELAKQIPQVKKDGGDIAPIMEEGKRIKETIASKQGEMDATQQKLADQLSRIPNIPADEVPQGSDETGNKEIRVVGNKPHLSANAAKQHFDLGEALGMMDFERAAKISGSRFVVLKHQLARLERSLANFMLDHNTREFGYTEMSVPLMARSDALFGTGQLPKFEEDLFKTTTDHYLIPTSEVSLTNLVMDEIVSDKELPLRYTAYTPCFRSEAGSAGKDTRGMIRQHQFGKVEMVSLTHPDASNDEHERMTSCAESLLQKLGLHYRVMLLCSGDMGFSARKTYDIEVWLPGQNAYREISSCSNCGDFQARRMKARFKKDGDKGTQFVHTLNGSGLPTGRTLVAILENYQQADGSIIIPEALRPYMNNEEVIKIA